MELFSKENFIKTVKDKKFPIHKIGELLKKIFKLDRIHALYQQDWVAREDDFIDSVLQLLKVDLEYNANELKRIPATGPFIVISNHPLGTLDQLVLLKTIRSIRKDFKLLSNTHSTKTKPVEHLIVSSEQEPEYELWKKGNDYLKQDGCIGLFPSPSGSPLNIKDKISDKKWDQETINKIYASQVPVVPVYIHASRRLLFHLMSLVIPTLKTIRLSSELLNQSSQSVRLRIGNPIKVKEQQELEDLEMLGRYFRSKTYVLGSALKLKYFYPKGIQFNLKKPEPVAEALPVEVLTEEIRSIHEEHFVLETDQYKMYLAPAEKIPNIILEIGRQRELTYREVGEGSNKSLDLDEYDLYYKHLFLWDANANQLVGAYRLGIGPDIFPKHGTKGFYINTLFKFLQPFNPILEQSLELGRSFITSSYQRKPQPLFMLWKGILFELMNNKHLRYVIGPVSISDDYSKRSKKLIAEFITKFYFDQEKAAHIKPRNKYLYKPSKEDELFLQTIQNDLSKLDKVIEDIEPKLFKVPVLIKKYIKQNARIIGFNQDPKFSNVLDAFMIMDINELPQSSFEKLSRELETTP